LSSIYILKTLFISIGVGVWIGVMVGVGRS